MLVSSILAENFAKGREYSVIQLSKNSTRTFLLERKSPEYAKGNRCNLVS